MPRPVIYGFLILISLSFIPMAFLAKARVTGSTLPRIQVIPDMDNQPKFKAQAANPLFADDRAMRPHVPGTVARGELQPDERFAAGRHGEEWVTNSPIPVTEQMMARGQDRYGIYCAVCHGLSGKGNGMVSRRAEELQEGTWVPPTDLTSATINGRADGHIFNTITHGIRNMPAYGPQISVADRWAIVAYVRALQRSGNATLDDVPEDVRPTLK